MRLRTACAAMLLASVGLARGEPTTGPSVGPMIHWPDGWADRKSSKAATRQLGINAEIDAGALLNESPTSDYQDNYTLADWSKRRYEALQKTPTFQKLGGKFDALHDVKVGGHDAMTGGVDTVVNAIKLHYQYYFFKQGDYFCLITLWSSPSKWAKAEAQADALVAATN